MENFFCPICLVKYSIGRYLFNGSEYRDKVTKKILVCTCVPASTALQYIEKEFTGVPNFGKVMSMSKEQRHEVMKKRSSAHYKKEIKEVERDMHIQMVKGMKK